MSADDLRPDDMPEVCNGDFGGLSWNQFLPAINLYTVGGSYEPDGLFNKKYTAIYIDIDGSMEVLKVFHPTTWIEHTAMMNTLTEWNYGTCKLCPVVRASLDWG